MQGLRDTVRAGCSAPRTSLDSGGQKKASSAARLASGRLSQQAVSALHTPQGCLPWHLLRAPEARSPECRACTRWRPSC